MAEEKIEVNNNLKWPATEEEGELAVDLYETPTELVLQAIIGGVKINDLDISITNDMITIKGVRVKKDDEKIEKVYYKECFWGPFSRVLILPKEINADEVKATLKNGFLTVRLPKLEKTKEKIVRISEE
ncbi:MAG TPA: Hsp20/alpha crystallin family protein [Candidatus Paceibacterota bacterium]|nr:Hsp20/alpha crystallin family protein [Candidatus Paceibacterota bacterium]